MASTPTLNKALPEPAIGDTGWGTTLNSMMSIVDTSLGSASSFTVTGVGSSPTAVTTGQLQTLIWNFVGTLTANVNYQIPATVGGVWVVKNSTTGNFTLTISSATVASSSIVVPQGGITSIVYCDGAAGVTFADNRTQSDNISPTITTTGGSTTLTQNQYSNNILIVAGALIADATLVVPSGVIGQWTVVNGTSGAFNLFVNNSGLSTPIGCAQGTTTIVYSDGVNVGLSDGRAISGSGILAIANGGTGGSTATAARTNLGLGTSAVLDAGVAANDVVQLNGSAQIPAVDGSLITKVNRITYMTAVATTSGTSFTFTIPSTAVRITIMFSAVQTDGTSPKQLRLGAGSAQTSGYRTSSFNYVSGASVIQPTGGFQLNSVLASDVLNGSVVFEFLNGTTWTCNGCVANSASAGVFFVTGAVDLGGANTIVRLGTVGGTNNFVGGTIQVCWE